MIKNTPLARLPNNAAATRQLIRVISGNFQATRNKSAAYTGERDLQTGKDSIGNEERHVRKIPTVRGFDIMRNPKLNKSTAFTIVERQILGIHGLLPPSVDTQAVQMHRIMTELREKTPLQQYIMLTALLTRNERLFYSLLVEHTEELMPIVYTPTVGLACQEYGLIFRDPRGLFVTIHDLGHVRDIVANWPESHVQAVVMTDGERILGLGDLGCNGMGIPIGKLALYTACGGIHPSSCLPIIIDVGTDNEALLNDPVYIGLRQRRDRSERYDQLVDELIEALRERFGENVLIQFEDFGNQNAFRFLDRYKDTICTFNDDIQGTAAVSVAGALASLKVSGMKLSDHRFLFLGAGEAACGIAHLLKAAMMKEGLTKEQAHKHIWMHDKRGLLVKDRPCGTITAEKVSFAHEHPPIESFEESVATLKPTAIIGVSGVGGLFTEKVCKQMTEHTERPLIFALSNPTSHAECTAEQAYTWTDGKCLFASGSPFGPVTLADGRHFIPGQGNNVYIFPGIALGVIASRSTRINHDMFLASAESLADHITAEDLAEGRLYPPLTNIKEVSYDIAVRVADVAYRSGVATLMPEPESKESIVDAHLYDPKYKSYVPVTYAYPATHEVV